MGKFILGSTTVGVDVKSSRQPKGAKPCQKSEHTSPHLHQSAALNGTSCGRVATASNASATS